MNKVFYLLMVTSLLYFGLVFGKEVACIPRVKMGETTTGQHLYERDAELKIRNLSRIDFDKLTIISAEGDRSRIVRVEENLYKTAGTGAPYYFITMTKSRLSLSSQSGVTPLILRCCCASRPHSRRIYRKPYFIAPIH